MSESKLNLIEQDRPQACPPSPHPSQHGRNQPEKNANGNGNANDSQKYPPPGANIVAATGGVTPSLRKKGTLICIVSLRVSKFVVF